jgi:hypothetical protein
MLILSKYIVKHELNPLGRALDINDIIRGARKVIEGLATEIKPPQTNYGFRYFKVRIGKTNQMRMIVFLISANQKIVPILVRKKKDKIFGMNMAMNNKIVVSQINKNLNKIIDDIKNGDFEEIKF